MRCKVPEHIESLWISVRPNWLPRAISVIIVAGVYYPGSDSIYTPSQEEIILHLTEMIHQLYQNYANPLFVVMGDFNDLKVDEICDACKLLQVVNVPTRKDATLDLILSNSDNKLYKTPFTLPSIGKSDHLCVLYEPTDNQSTKTTKETITIRRFKKYALIEFGSWLTKFKWHDLLMISDVNLKISYFFTIMWIMIDKFFPLIKVVVTKDDKKWITSEIKYLIAERQKAHLSQNYDLRDHLTKKIKKAIKKAKINDNAHEVDKFSSSTSKK